MTIDTTTDQALRDEIAQAIDREYALAPESLADAVLPVVQAHEKALRAELDQLKTLRRAAELVRLREAVTALAGDMERQASKGVYALGVQAEQQREDAARLRSLLDKP